MDLGVLFVTEPAIFILSPTFRRIFPVIFIYPREIHDFCARNLCDPWRIHEFGRRIHISLVVFIMRPGYSWKSVRMKKCSSLRSLCGLIRLAWFSWIGREPCIFPLCANDCRLGLGVTYPFHLRHGRVDLDFLSNSPVSCALQVNGRHSRIIRAY